MGDHLADWHTDTEVIAWLRRWPEERKQHSHFAWPTYAMGYEQHMRFLAWYNLKGAGFSPVEAARVYADKLEAGEIPAFEFPDQWNPGPVR